MLKRMYRDMSETEPNLKIDLMCANRPKEIVRKKNNNEKE